jgi:3-oxoacyl-[acyl-carrier-protein] synthase-3
MSIYSKIIGTGSCLPPNRVTNDDLTRILGEKGLETSDEWIVSRSGISARHYVAPGVVASDLATEAATRALAMAGLQASDIDLIILATSTPDFIGGFPSTASPMIALHWMCKLFVVVLFMHCQLRIISLNLVCIKKCS